ncbi:MAG: hypothetical protein PHS57_10845, partial [Alphaproteobacteria bacterium]|nr:hypothetical protein [Alphaproteobacteria bacterium]
MAFPNIRQRVDALGKIVSLDGANADAALVSIEKAARSALVRASKAVAENNAQVMNRNLFMTESILENGRERLKELGLLPDAPASAVEETKAEEAKGAPVEPEVVDSSVDLNDIKFTEEELRKRSDETPSSTTVEVTVPSEGTVVVNGNNAQEVLDEVGKALAEDAEVVSSTPGSSTPLPSTPAPAFWWQDDEIVDAERALVKARVKKDLIAVGTSEEVAEAQSTVMAQGVVASARREANPDLSPLAWYEKFAPSIGMGKAPAAKAPAVKEEVAPVKAAASTGYAIDSLDMDGLVELAKSFEMSPRQENALRRMDIEDVRKLVADFVFGKTTLAEFNGIVNSRRHEEEASILNNDIELKKDLSRPFENIKWEGTPEQKEALKSLSTIALQIVGDYELGELPLHLVGAMGKDADILRSVGLVYKKKIVDEDGYESTVEFVHDSPLWDERRRRTEDHRAKRKAELTEPPAPKGSLVDNGAHSFVDVASITPVGDRASFDQAKIEAMADEMLRVGALSEPLLVRRTGGDTFEVVGDGLRYWAAVRAREKNPKLGEMTSALIVDGDAAAFEKQREILGGKNVVAPDGFIIDERGQGLVDVKAITPRTKRDAFDPMLVDMLADSILELGGLVRPLAVKRTGAESFETVGDDLAYWAAVRAKEKSPRFEMVNSFIYTPSQARENAPVSVESVSEEQIPSIDESARQDAVTAPSPLLDRILAEPTINKRIEIIDGATKEELVSALASRGKEFKPNAGAGLLRSHLKRAVALEGMNIKGMEIYARSQGIDLGKVKQGELPSVVLDHFAPRAVAKPEDASSEKPIPLSESDKRMIFRSMEQRTDE